MSSSFARDSSGFPVAASSPRSPVHSRSKQARRLKLELSQRLVGVRAAIGLVLRDVHDRPQLVHKWEHPDEPHAPTILHIVEQGLDPVSRPYALESIEWAREKIARAAEVNPSQLSIFDLIARNTTA